MFGKYASFVVPAYAASAFVLALAVVRIRVLYRNRLAELTRLEGAGASRRSGRRGKAK